MQYLKHLAHLPPPPVSIQRLAEDLAGTTGDGMNDAVKELTTDEAGQLDMLVFCCTSCGWWFNQNDNAMNDDEDLDEWICKECHRDNE